MDGEEEGAGGGSLSTLRLGQYFAGVGYVLAAVIFL